MNKRFPRDSRESFLNGHILRKPDLADFLGTNVGEDELLMGHRGKDH